MDPLAYRALQKKIGMPAAVRGNDSLLVVCTPQQHLLLSPFPNLVFGARYVPLPDGASDAYEGARSEEDWYHAFGRVETRVAYCTDATRLAEAIRTSGSVPVKLGGNGLLPEALWLLPEAIYYTGQLHWDGTPADDASLIRSSIETCLRGVPDAKRPDLVKIDAPLEQRTFVSVMGEPAERVSSLLHYVMPWLG